MEIDYEKKYEEALAKARAGKTLEEIFPEMNESEDERIRKLLVWQVHRNIEDETNDLAQSVYDGIKGHDPDLEESIEDWKKCLAYLEKQKEHQETCTTFLAKILKHSAEGFRNVLKKKGINYIPHESFWTNTAGTFSKQECNEFYKWMDDMTMELVTEETPEYKKGFKDGLDASKKEQKPAEWSEEDERKLKLCEDSFLVPQTRQHLIQQGLTPGDMVSWLKFLRPQPYTVSIKDATKFGNLEYERGVKDGIQSEKNRHWKPSEEQMQGLRRGIVKADEGSDAKNAMVSLYNDLEKL